MAIVEAVEVSRVSATAVDRISTTYTRAFTGRIGKGAEVRSTRDGKPWASFPVAADTGADGEAPATWVRVALFGDTVGTVDPRLTKGTQVYCEGRLSLGTWTAATVKPGRGSPHAPYTER